MSVIYLSYQGTRIAMHPKNSSGLMVRVDTPQRAIVIWDGGYKVFELADLPSSWQKIQNQHGSQLPIRIKRTATFGWSHGANNLAIEFQ